MPSWENVLHTEFRAHGRKALEHGWSRARVEEFALADFEQTFQLTTVGAALRWEGDVLHAEVWMIREDS